MRKVLKVLANQLAGTTEGELVVRCQKGDRLAFHQLYQSYQQRVRSTLYQLCGKQMLDDLVQEVFFRVWKGLAKLRQPDYFATWLYRITWNVATDQRRQLAIEQLAKAQTNKEEDELPLSETLFREEDSPDLMRLHYQELVQRGLQSLSLEHRAVVVLHDLEDLPQKEIAKILELPVGTVKSRLYYGRNALKNFFEQQGAL